MPTQLYTNQEVITNPDDTLTLRVAFETITRAPYESKRRMTAVQPVTAEMRDWIETNHGALEAGISQRDHSAERLPVVGGHAELLTLNGEVYFLVPAGSRVTFREYGTQADLQDGRHLSPYFRDEQDPLISLLRSMRQNSERLGPLMDALDRGIGYLGELNLPTSIRQYGIVPAMAYLGKGARERIEQIKNGRLDRTQESGRLLAMSGVEAIVQEPLVASL